MNKHDTIQITSPHQGECVDHRQLVTGTISIPNVPVRVYVYSNDKKWYKQQPAEVIGNEWSTEAVFGFEDSFGKHFTVWAVAVSGEMPAEDVPPDVPHSHHVHVKRKTEFEVIIP